TMLHEERLLIDGELVPAENVRTYETISPATEEVLGVAADASAGDVRRAIAAARAAFDTTEWSRDKQLRLRCLRQLHQGLVDNSENLRKILIDEVGMPRSMTYSAGLDAPVAAVKWYADELEKYEFTEDLGVVFT